MGSHQAIKERLYSPIQIASRKITCIQEFTPSHCLVMSHLKDLCFPNIVRMSFKLAQGSDRYTCGRVPKQIINIYNIFIFITNNLYLLLPFLAFFIFFHGSCAYQYVYPSTTIVSLIFKVYGCNTSIIHVHHPWGRSNVIVKP